MLLLLPERLPSLLYLVGFWIPPALCGWALAAWHERQRRPLGPGAAIAWVAAIALTYAAGWFLFNLQRMPPYIPGAVIDPTIASPRATAGLAVVAAALILPGSAFACGLAFSRRRAGVAQ